MRLAFTTTSEGRLESSAEEFEPEAGRVWLTFSTLLLLLLLLLLLPTGQHILLRTYKLKPVERKSSFSHILIFLSMTSSGHPLRALSPTGQLRCIPH